MGSKSCTVMNYGPMDEWDKHILKLPEEIKEQTGIGEFPGKRFAQNDLGLSFMDFSINKFPPGLELPFAHKHTNQEEVYIVLQGEGEMFIDGELVPFCSGTAIRVDQHALRSIRNTNLTEPMYYICIRAQGGKIAEIKDDVPKPEMLDWDEF